MPAPEQVTLQRLVDAADGELWAFLDSEVRAARLTPVEARDLLHEVLPGWGGQYEDAAAAVAADLYDQKRLANDLDLIIPYRVELPEPATAARWGILASWAIPAVDEEFSWDAAFRKIVGGAHRTIADAHRNTTMHNSIRDPAARGWQRVGRGDETCNFCHMLITRGDVYRQSTVDFRSHDNCRCSAESVFGKISSAEMRAYERSARNTTGRHDEARQLDRARAKELLQMEAEGSL